MFMKVVKEKRPEMCTGEVLIYWDSAHSDWARAVKEFSV
jgi:hypothetical protein